MVTSDLAEIEAESSKLTAKGDFTMLEILHHFSSGMKALITEYVYNGTDQLRQSCGGAGYLISSGIASLWAE